MREAPQGRHLLQNWMTQVGLSQAQLADRLSVSPSAVSHWLSGNRRPSLEILIAIEKPDGEVTVNSGRMTRAFFVASSPLTTEPKVTSTPVTADWRSSPTLVCPPDLLAMVPETISAFPAGSV